MQVLGLCLVAYLFHGLGILDSHQLPKDLGIPEHVRQLAAAAQVRKRDFEDQSIINRIFILMYT
jgi:hypothetical protein